MIILLNTNNYIGGGETLCIRLARYLHENNVEYEILTYQEPCWILEEAKKNNLKYRIWPSKIDSINYQNNKERKNLVNYLKDVYLNYKELRIFTFCYRDLHNALYVFCQIKEINVYFSHGLYHPEDILYLSSYALNKKRIIEQNRNILKKLSENSGILFVNDNGIKYSFNVKTKSELPECYNLPIIPIPIQIKSVRDDNESILKKTEMVDHIICISRMVDFKIGAIMGIVRFVEKHRNFKLTLIGYGPWKFVISCFVFFKRMKNVVIMPGVKPEELEEYINKADIGYAQGTSILEIAKIGKPTIVAPYSKLSDIFNTKFKCLGVFGDNFKNGGLGDITDLADLKAYSIEECMFKIIKDYKDYEKRTLSFVDNFDVKIVCKQIYDFILYSKFTNQDLNFNCVSFPKWKYLAKRILISIGKI